MSLKETVFQSLIKFILENMPAHFKLEKLHQLRRLYCIIKFYILNCGYRKCSFAKINQTTFSNKLFFRFWNSSWHLWKRNLSVPPVSSTMSLGTISFQDFVFRKELFHFYLPSIQICNCQLFHQIYRCYQTQEMRIFKILRLNTVKANNVQSYTTRPRK